MTVFTVRTVGLCGELVEQQTMIDSFEDSTQVEHHQYYGLPIIQWMNNIVLYTNEDSFTTVCREVCTLKDIL